MLSEEKKKDIVDEALLLVRGSTRSRAEDKEYVKKLANAISQVYFKHDVARLRCIGAAAVNNAVKASAKAIEEMENEEIYLWMKPSFYTVKFGEDEKTAIMFEIKSIEE